MIGWGGWLLRGTPSGGAGRLGPHGLAAGRAGECLPVVDGRGDEREAVSVVVKRCVRYGARGANQRPSVSTCVGDIDAKATG